jgi:hypothetical protein
MFSSFFSHEDYELSTFGNGVRGWESYRTIFDFITGFHLWEKVVVVVVLLSLTDLDFPWRFSEYGQFYMES